MRTSRQELGNPDNVPGMLGRTPTRFAVSRLGVVFRAWLACALAAFLSIAATAQAERVPSLVPGGPDVQVPKELMPWVPWITSSITEGLCPKIGEREQCVWPASLDIDVGSDGAEFNFETFVDVDSWVTLPGTVQHWPEAVRADGKPLVVLSQSGAPAARLTRGAHRVSGRFLWEKAPETLPLPASVGLVRLKVKGRSIAFPRREDSGALWLQAGANDEQAGSERIDLEVFRRIDDAVPLRIETRVVLRVAGKNRQVRLTGVTLLGSRTVSLDSPVAARFELNDELLIQVAAGEHQVTIKSLYAAPPERVLQPKHAPPWPEHETWVFVADNALRQVVLTGAPNVDPAQTNLPAEWKAYPTFVVSKDQGLAFETQRRGEPEPPPNQLTLQRQWWLAFDGRSYTVLDRFGGTMNRDFRLDLAPYALGHAASKGQDLLVTRSASGAYGVELRDPKVDLTAEWRYAGPLRALPAIGWQTDIAHLSGTLNLPPGWDVLHVSGVDSTSDTWWSRWSLWGFFYVLIIAIAVARLLGYPLGLLALVTLSLIYARDDAPMASWAVLLVLLALLRWIPEGWFRRGLRLAWFGAVLVFAALAVDFSIGEIRAAFFPTTRPPYGANHDVDVANLVEKAGSLAATREPGALEEEQVATVQQQLKNENAAAPRAKPEAEAAAPPDVEEPPRRGAKLGSGISLAKRQRYDAPSPMTDPDAVVQTGPGLPSWRWKTIDMKWSGPVQRDQRIYLYLLSPFWSTLFGCLRVLGVAGLGFYLVRRTDFGATPTQSGFSFKVGRSVATAIALLGMLLLPSAVLLLPSVVRAEPSSDVLKELKTRLIQPPDCGNCLEVETLEVVAVQATLETRATVHAGAVTAYRVPGPARSFVPEVVLVDGQASNAMLLDSDGYLHVRLTPGTHRIQAKGPVPGTEWVLTPGSNCHRVTVKAEGYSVDGLRDGRVEGSLHFTATDQPKAEAIKGTDTPSLQRQFPPWLEVTRNIEIGLVWKITTEFTRKSPTGQPLSLRYPLLPNEEVTETGAIVEQRQLVVSLGRDDATVRYRSVLQPSDGITLLAATDKPWSEHWQLRCAALWHCLFEGVSPYARTDANGYAPKFRPWPGESLKVSIARPAAAPGATRTVERVQARFTPGHRLLLGELEFVAKVSKAGAISVQLEPGATLQNLLIDGRDEPMRSQGEKLEFSLQPGRHMVKVDWHEPKPQRFWFTAPKVVLDGAAVNAKVLVNLPSDRWLLFTYGPSWGPKVLLWSYVLMLIGAAWILVRIPKNPLRVWQWALLGIGLTQVPVAIALVVAAWFFLMAYRGAYAIPSRTGKRLAQLGLGFYTVAFLGCLCGAVYDGLVSNPDMLVAGSSSSDVLHLAWYVDRIDGALPTPLVLSLPVVVFRSLNLLWALWLASSLVGWLRWGFEQFSRGGLWVPKATRAPVITPLQPAMTPPSAQTPDEGSDLERP